MPRLRLRPKRGQKSIGLYGKPQDFLTRIRAPGTDLDHRSPVMDTMPEEFLLNSDGRPKKKRRQMSGMV